MQGNIRNDEDVEVMLEKMKNLNRDDVKEVARLFTIALQGRLKMLDFQAAQSLNVGDEVTFKKSTQIIAGKVVKIIRGNVKVLTVNGMWTVSAGLLTKR